VTGLLKIYIDICLLRASPADLPPYAVLLGLAATAYVLVGVLLLAPVAGIGTAVLQTLVDVALLAALLRLVLQVHGRAERFPQTLSALLGTGALLGLVAWPLLLSMYAAQAQGGEPAALSILALLALFVWTLVIIGHILRHSLSTSHVVGVLLATGYVVVSTVVLSALFPREV
jgi:hypothetical protein